MKSFSADREPSLEIKSVIMIILMSADNKFSSMEKWQGKWLYSDGVTAFEATTQAVYEVTTAIANIAHAKEVLTCHWCSLPYLYTDSQHSAFEASRSRFENSRVVPRRFQQAGCWFDTCDETGVFLYGSPIFSM